jgi:hypothetical protein
VVSLKGNRSGWSIWLVIFGMLLVGFAAGRLTAPGPLTARALMQRIDAGPVDCVATRTPLSQPVYAFDWGSCRLEGDEIQVLTFRASSALERYDHDAEDFGRWILRGDTWRVTGDSLPNARAIQSEIGGTLTQ